MRNAHFQGGGGQQLGRHALAFVAEHPGAAPGQAAVVQVARAFQGGGDQRHFQPRQERGQIRVLVDGQREMRALAAAQHFRRPCRRRARGQEHPPHARRGASAQQGADIAGILDPVEEHAVLLDSGRHGRRGRANHESHALPAFHAGQHTHQPPVQGQAAFGRHLARQGGDFGRVQARGVEHGLLGRAMALQPRLAQMHAVQQHGFAAFSGVRGQASQRLHGGILARADVFHATRPKALMGAKLRRCSGHGPCNRRRSRCSGVP